MKFMDKNNIIQLIEEKEYDKAKKLIIEALTNNEQDNELVKLLGLCNVNLNCLDEALKNFDEFLKMDPDDALSLYYMATIYLSKENIDKAESLLKKVIELRNDYLDAYKTLAITFIKQKKISDVFLLEEKMLELGCDDVQIYEILSTAALEITKFSMAVEYLEKAVEIEPNNSRLFNKLGLTYFSSGNVQKSIELYNKALQLDPKDLSALYNIGMAYLSMYSFENAYEYLKTLDKYKDAIDV